MLTQEKDKYSFADRQVSTGSGRQINELSEEEGYFSRKLNKDNFDRPVEYMSTYKDPKQQPSLS